MGYNTDFRGRWDLNKKLDDDTFNLLVGLASTRRMKRDLKGFGVDGEFYHKDDGDFGQSTTPDIIDFNRPPSTQPSLWLNWVPTNDKMGIEWSGGEKFYDYVEWITYLIGAILEPRGYVLNGSVEWRGEEWDDLGVIFIEDNVVRATNRG